MQVRRVPGVHRSTSDLEMHGWPAFLMSAPHSGAHLGTQVNRPRHLSDRYLAGPPYHVCADML